MLRVLQSSKLEEAAKHVLEHEGAVVADVRVIVDGGAASVDAHFARLLRDKGFEFSGQGIVELNFAHRRPVLFLDDWRNLDCIWK